MNEIFAAKPTKTSRPIVALEKGELKAWLKGQRVGTRNWLASTDFKAKPGEFALVPGRDGGLERVVLGVSSKKEPWDWSGLVRKLPPGRYHVATELGSGYASTVALGWALGHYRYDRYKSHTGKAPLLAWPEGADQAEVVSLFEGISLARDLINTPAGDLGPTALGESAKELAARHKAKFTLIVGDKLLEQNYPTIHAVGRACTDAPRLIDFTWGDPKHPKLTLVGKGVCFDTGGLDLKPADNMKLMKKDMGGAALVLGLAHAVMSAGLPVRLRVLVPAVENSVAGNAFHPLDVIKTRKGLTVEIGHTDAEGRLILCDALAEADTENPDLLIDAATLTGAARVALGTELPALFTNDDDVAAAVIAAGLREGDPLWRLPLHEPYKEQLKTPMADLNNQGGPFGGAITAALFLQSFISRRQRWVHIDTMGWNLRSRPGRPVGGEAFALRALYRMLVERYGA
ncbi:MAG: leucyl aminopeptidase family protein [Polyangiaceae bacterium]